MHYAILLCIIMRAIFHASFGLVIIFRLHQKPHVHGPFWAREFATAHADIDDIVNDNEAVPV